MFGHFAAARRNVARLFWSVVLPIVLEQLGAFVKLEAVFQALIGSARMYLMNNHSCSWEEAKYYLIFLHSIPERPLSSEVVDLHAAHLAELDDSGKLVMAGPLVERSGGLIVLRIESAAEAIAIAEEDPLVRGAYQTYELCTWLMSNRKNNYRPNIQQVTDK